MTEVRTEETVLDVKNLQTVFFTNSGLFLAVDDESAASEVALPGTITETVYTGPATRYLVSTDGGVDIIAERPNAHDLVGSSEPVRGDRVQVAWNPVHAARLP